MRKRIICDSSSLISLSMNCMLPVLAKLGESVDFIITQSVYDEIITNPKRGGHHIMGPLKFTALVESGVLKVERANESEVYDILEASNNIYYLHDRPLKIIQRGEAEALALAREGDVLLMDERTLRFLVERPDDLMSLLSHRMHRDITMKREKREGFQRYCEGVSIIRSSEIIAVAYEGGILQRYFSGKGKEVLRACLWALKMKGCSLSKEDIDEYLKMLK